MSTSRLARFSRMNVSEFVPYRAGSAVKLGTSMTVNSGAWSASRPGSTPMNMCLANRLCHAISVMTRIGEKLFVQRIEVLRNNRTIDLPPPHPVCARRFLDDELVVRGAARVLAGTADERPIVGHEPFTAADRLFVQRRHTEVPVHARQVHHAFELEAPLLHLRHLLPYSAANAAAKPKSYNSRVTDAKNRPKAHRYPSGGVSRDAIGCASRKSTPGRDGGRLYWTAAAVPVVDTVHGGSTRASARRPSCCRRSARGRAGSVRAPRW